MKKLFLLGLAVLVFIACKQQRYTQNSPEIEIVKTLIKNYNAQKYDMSIFADTSKTLYNTSDKYMSASETIAYHKANDAQYASRQFLVEDQEYEMVITDDDETWVNCWLKWEGKLSANNQKIAIPIHLTYRFIQNKIVEEVGMWDSSQIVLALQDIEAAKMAAETAEAINLEE